MDYSVVVKQGFWFFYPLCCLSASALTPLAPLFSPSLTKCDCLSQTSQGALLVYSKALLFSSVETLILKIRAPCLCNVCSSWLKCFEHATLKGSAVCHHFGLPHKQSVMDVKTFLFQAAAPHSGTPLQMCYVFINLLLQARNYINSLSHMPKRNFADVFLGANPLGEFLCLRCP